MGEATPPRSGFLSEESRTLAVQHAIRFVATYGSQAMYTRERLKHSVANDPEVDAASRTSAAILFRIHLAAGEALIPILTGLGEAPTFQYRVERGTSTGSIAGRLDVRRYYLDQARVTVPRTYPVRRPVKDITTPENVLAVRAAIFVRASLAWSMSKLGHRPEEADGRAGNEIRDRLTRALTAPSLKPVAEALRRLEPVPVDELRSRVLRRLQTGRISRPRRYEALLTWFDEYPLVSGEVGEGREAQTVWGSHLGADFDTRLFELWLLQLVADAATDRYSEATTKYTGRLLPTDAPVLTWQAGTESLSLYYQAPLSKMFDDAPLWADGEKSLGGAPDVSINISGVLGSTTGIIDAKLRQRPGQWPADEIYKLLGYFANAGLHTQGLGGIVYHAPTDSSVARYELRPHSGSGRVLAVGLDPAHEATARAAVGEILDLIAEAHFGSSMHDEPDPGAQNTTDTGESRADLQQRLSAQILVEAARRTSSIESFQAQLRDVTGGRCHLLDDDVREMFACSLMFGQATAEDFDASGAILSACNGVETILRRSYLGTENSQPKMLGPLLSLLGNAVNCDALLPGKAKVAAEAAKAAIGPEALKRLAGAIGDLDHLRVSYRNPSAHEGAMSAHTWIDFYTLVFAPGSGLLGRLLP